MTRIWRPSCARKDIGSEEFSAPKCVLSTVQNWDMNCSASHSCCPVDLVFPLSSLWMIPKACVDTQVPHSFSPALILKSEKAVMASISYLRLSGTKTSQLRRPISDLHFWLLQNEDHDDSCVVFFQMERLKAPCGTFLKKMKLYALNNIFLSLDM